MEPVGLLSLPVELLCHIGQFLPVKDIMSCSATCHYLRNAFNHNSVWKKHIPDTFTPDLQNGKFDLESFYEEETLNPLCENRVIFMNKINLLQNWKNAEFVKHSASHASEEVCVKGHVIYKDRYLFLLRRSLMDIKLDAIEVWDIIKEPVLLIKLKINSRGCSSIYIVGEYLVFVQCVRVIVFKIKIPEKKLPLLFFFVITENEVFHHPSDHLCGPHNNLSCLGWRTSTVDHYLLANQFGIGPNSCVFHVWDIANARKVGSFSPVTSTCEISYSSHSGSNWLFKDNSQPLNDLYVFQFDIEKKSCSAVVFQVPKKICHSVVFNSKLIVFALSVNGHGTICSVYDFRTSRKCQERYFICVRRNREMTTTKVINEQFVILCIDGFHVVNAITLETMQQFPSDGVSFITHQFNVHGSIFILAKPTNQQNILEMWNMSKKEKIAKNVHESVYSNFFLNSSCTKLVCIGSEFSVYHFQ